MDESGDKKLDRMISLPNLESKKQRDQGKLTLIEAKKEVLTLLGSGCSYLVGWKIIEGLEALNIHSKRYPQGMEIIELSGRFPNFKKICMERFQLDLNNMYHLTLGNLWKNPITFCVSILYNDLI
jgi:hypothetical protein